MNNTSAHNKVLQAIAQKYLLVPILGSKDEVFFALMMAAMVQKERRFVPLLGHSTDRRTLQHIGEVFREDNVHTLMCFICGGKHVAHQGYDKFGNPAQKGDVQYVGVFV